MNRFKNYKPGIRSVLVGMFAAALLLLWVLFAGTTYISAIPQTEIIGAQMLEAKLTALEEQFCSAAAQLDENSLPGKKAYLMQKALDSFYADLNEDYSAFMRPKAAILDEDGRLIVSSGWSLCVIYTNENTGRSGYAVIESDDVSPHNLYYLAQDYDTLYLTGRLYNNGIFDVGKISADVLTDDGIVRKTLEFHGGVGKTTIEVKYDDMTLCDNTPSMDYTTVQELTKSAADSQFGLDREITLYNGEKCRLVAQVEFLPHEMTMDMLVPVYCITLALVLILIMVFAWFVSSRISEPLQALNDDFERGTRLTRVVGSRRSIREISRLAENYDNIQSQQNDSHDELMRLKKALTYAQEAEQSRRHTSSAVAHELKTPLAVIHGYAEALGDDISQQEREKYLDTILKESEAMDELVNDMLDVSRLEAGKTKLEKESFSLGELTEEVFAKLDSSMKKKSLTLGIDGDRNIMAFADRSRIGQVITNFATNAIRHAPTGSTIAVTISQTYGQVTFRMKNSGEPIPGEKLPRLWEAYYQADENGGSAGLGLSICKNIIDLHGGSVEAKNSADGVEFSFRISSQMTTASTRTSRKGGKEPVVWTARLDEEPLAKKYGKSNLAILLTKIAAGIAAVVLVFVSFDVLPMGYFVPLVWMLVAAVGVVTLMAVIRQQRLRKMSRSALVTEGDTVTLVTYLIQNDETTCESLIGSMNVSMKNGGFNSEDLLGFNLGNSGRKKGSKAYNSAVLAMQDEKFVLDKYRSGYGQVELTRRYDCTLDIQGDKLVIRGAKEPGGEITGWTVPDVFGPVEL